MDEEKTDRLIREFLESSPSRFIEEDGDETFFRFWDDEGHKIRSCLECSYSEFKSPIDGVWVVYWTPDHQLWVINNIGKENYNLKCSLCEKWFYRFTKKDTTDEKFPQKEVYWKEIKTEQIK